jgi:hypothetical protein
MKKVCLFNYPPIDNFHGYQIETFDPLSYFPKGSRWSLSELIICHKTACLTVSQRQAQAIVPDTHRFTDPTGARTARFSRHRREGISYPLRDYENRLIDKLSPGRQQALEAGTDAGAREAARSLRGIREKEHLEASGHLFAPQK